VEELVDDVEDGVESGSDIMFSGERLPGIRANANKTRWLPKAPPAAGPKRKSCSSGKPCFITRA
jgi:hypothetical protein